MKQDFGRSAKYGFEKGQAKKKKDLKIMEAGVPDEQTKEPSLWERIEKIIKGD